MPLFEDSSMTYSINPRAFASTAFAEFPYENVDHVSLLASSLCPVCENGKCCLFRIKALSASYWFPSLMDSVFFPGSKTLLLASPLPHKRLFLPSSSLRNMLLGITQIQKSNHTFSLKCLGSSSSWMEPPQAACYVSKRKKGILCSCFSLLLGCSWDLRTMGLVDNN